MFNFSRQRRKTNVIVNNRLFLFFPAPHVHRSMEVQTLPNTDERNRVSIYFCAVVYRLLRADR